MVVTGFAFCVNSGQIPVTYLGVDIRIGCACCRSGSVHRCLDLRQLPRGSWCRRRVIGWQCSLGVAHLRILVACRWASFRNQGAARTSIRICTHSSIARRLHGLRRCRSWPLMSLKSSQSWRGQGWAHCLLRPLIFLGLHRLRIVSWSVTLLPGGDVTCSVAICDSGSVEKLM